MGDPRERFFRIQDDWFFKNQSNFTAREWRVVLIIAHSVNGINSSTLNSSSSEISEKLSMAKTHFNATIRSLIKKGIIKKSQKGLSLCGGILPKYKKSILSSNETESVSVDNSILSSNETESVSVVTDDIRKIGKNDSILPDLQKSILSSNETESVSVDNSILSSNETESVSAVSFMCKKEGEGETESVSVLSSSKDLKAFKAFKEKKEKNFLQKKKKNFENLNSQNKAWENMANDRFDLVWLSWDYSARGSMSDCLQEFERIIADNVDDFEIFDKIEIALCSYCVRKSYRDFTLKLKNWLIEFENWYDAFDRSNFEIGSFWNYLKTEISQGVEK